MSPTYLPNDREKAAEDQNGLAREMDTCRERVQELTRLLEDADPVLAKSPEVIQVVAFIKKTASRPQTVTEFLDPCDKLSYADIAAGRVSPSPFSDASDKNTEIPTQLFVTKPITTMQALKTDDDNKNKEVVSKQIVQQNNESPLKICKEKQIVNDTTDNSISQKLPRRGRSPNRRCEKDTNEVSKLPPKPKTHSVDNRNKKSTKPAEDSEHNSSELHAKTLVKRLLAPETLRGRSPSPLYIAGETASYAQMVKSGSRPQSRSATPDRSKEQLVSLKTKEQSSTQKQPENKPENVAQKSSETASPISTGFKEPTYEKEIACKNSQKPVQKDFEKNIQHNSSNVTKSPSQQKGTAVTKDLIKAPRTSGNSSLVEKKPETSTLYKDSKQKPQSKSRSDKKHLTHPSTPVEHVTPPIVPLQPDIHITDFQSLTPDLQYSGAFTNPQSGLHYPPGLFQPYIGPEGEVASFIASGQQLISSGLGTYTTSESYCEQPLFVEDSYSVNTGIYSLQQTPDYQSQVFVSNSQGYIPNFGGGHTAYTHIENEPLALRVDNDGVSYASILAQGLSGDPHLNQSRLQLQTEAQQWDVPPTCDVTMVTSSVGGDRISNQEEDVSLKGMKRSKSPLLRNEKKSAAVKPGAQMEKVDISLLEKIEHTHGEKAEPSQGDSHNVKELTNSDKTYDSQQKKKKQKAKVTAQPAKNQELSENTKETNLPSQKSKSEISFNKNKKQTIKGVEIVSGGCEVNPEGVDVEQPGTLDPNNIKETLETSETLQEGNDRVESGKKAKKRGKQNSLLPPQSENKTLGTTVAAKEDMLKIDDGIDKSGSKDQSKTDTHKNEDPDHKTDTKTGKSKKKHKKTALDQNKTEKNPTEMQVENVGALETLELGAILDKSTIDKDKSKDIPPKKKIQNTKAKQEDTPVQKGQVKVGTQLKEDKKPSEVLGKPVAESKQNKIKDIKVEEINKTKNDNGEKPASEGDIISQKYSNVFDKKDVGDQPNKKKKKKADEKPQSKIVDSKETICLTADQKEIEATQTEVCHLTDNSPPKKKNVKKAQDTIPKKSEKTPADGKGSLNKHLDSSETMKENNLNERKNVAHKLKSETQKENKSSHVSEEKTVVDNAKIEKQDVDLPSSIEEKGKEKPLCSEPLKVDGNVTEDENKSKTFYGTKPIEDNLKKKKRSKKSSVIPKETPESTVSDQCIGPKVTLEVDGKNTKPIELDPTMFDSGTKKIKGKDIVKGGEDTGKMVSKELQNDSPSFIQNISDSSTKINTETMDSETPKDNAIPPKDLVDDGKSEQDLMISSTNETNKDVVNKETKSSKTQTIKKKGKAQKSKEMIEPKDNHAKVVSEDNCTFGIVEKVVPKTTLEISKDIHLPLDTPSDTCKTKQSDNLGMTSESSKHKKKSKKQNHPELKENPIEITQSIPSETNNQPLGKLDRGDGVSRGRQEIVCSTEILNEKGVLEPSGKKVPPTEHSESLFEQLEKNTPEEDGQSFNNIMVDIISKLDEAILKADVDTKENGGSKSEPLSSKEENTVTETGPSFSQANVQTTPEGFKSEIKFNVDNCGIVDNAENEECKDHAGLQSSQTESSSFKPLTRRNTKKSKQLAGKQLKNDAIKTTDSIGKEDLNNTNNVSSDLSSISDVDFSNVILSEKQEIEKQELTCESSKPSEIEESSQALKEIAPEAQKLVELETINIAKLPVTLFKKDIELPDNFPLVQDNVIVDASFLGQISPGDSSLNPTKIKKGSSTLQLAEESQTKTHSDDNSFKIDSSSDSSTKQINKKSSTPQANFNPDYSEKSKGKNAKKQENTEKKEIVEKSKPQKGDKLKKKDPKEAGAISNKNLSLSSTSKTKELSDAQFDMAPNTSECCNQEKEPCEEKYSLKEIVSNNDAQEDFSTISQPGNTAGAISNVSSSPHVIEIELNENTPLSDLTNDVIKPFLKPSSPNIFTFDKPMPKLGDIDKEDQNKEAGKESKSKCATDKNQSDRSNKIFISHKTLDAASIEEPTKQVELTNDSKNTLVDGSSSDKTADSSQMNVKQKKNQSKGHRQKSGQSVPGKPESYRGERKLKTPDKESISVGLETDSMTESNLSSDQSQGFPHINREKSPLLALAPPWMAKLVQRESSDHVAESGEEKICEDPVFKPSGKEAEIVSEAFEVGIFGSVKERPKPIATIEETKVKLDVSKKKQKKKGNTDLQIKDSIGGQSSMKSSANENVSQHFPEQESSTLVKSEKNTYTQSPSADSLPSENSHKNVGKENELFVPSSTSETNTGNDVDQTLEKIIIKKQKKADERRKPLEGDNVCKSKTEGVKEQLKDVEKDIHTEKLPENETKALSYGYTDKKAKIVGKEQLQGEKSENKVEIKSKKTAGKTNKKISQSNTQASVLPEKPDTGDVTVDVSKPNLVKETSDINLLDSPTSTIFLEKKPNNEIHSKEAKTETEAKGKDNDVQIGPSNQISKKTPADQVEFVKKGVFDKVDRKDNEKTKKNKKKEIKHDKPEQLKNTEGISPIETPIDKNQKVGSFESKHFIEKKLNEEVPSEDVENKIDTLEKDLGIQVGSGNKMSKITTSDKTEIVNKGIFDKASRKNDAKTKKNNKSGTKHDRREQHPGELQIQSLGTETAEVCEPKNNNLLKDVSHFQLTKMEGITLENKTLEKDYIGKGISKDINVPTHLDESSKVETSFEKTNIMTAESRVTGSNTKPETLETDHTKIMHFPPISTSDSTVEATNKTDYAECITPKESVASDTIIVSTQNEDEVNRSSSEVVVTKQEVVGNKSLIVLESYKEDFADKSVKKSGNEDKGLKPCEGNETGKLGSLKEDSFCNVAKYSLHEIEDAEVKLSEMKNTNENAFVEGGSSLSGGCENRNDGIISWAEIAAKEKVTKEEIKEVINLDSDTVPKPLPIVICVDEPNDQAPSIEPIVTVDSEGFLEFIPKKEIRKRKSRSRSRTRSDSDQLNVEDPKVVATKEISGVTVSTPNDKTASIEPNEISGEKYLGTQQQLENIPIEISTPQLKITEDDNQKSSETTKKLSKLHNEPKQMENKCQLLTVANKSSRNRSRSRSQTHGRSRSRSRKISETEREVDDILRAWSREEFLQQNLPLDVTFWVDKWKFDDAEKHLYELVNNSSSELILTVDTNEKHGDNDDEGPSSGPASPGSRFLDRSDQGNKSNIGTETLTADLPHGIGAWSDYSTYISDDKCSAQPQEKSSSSETPLRSFDGVDEQGNKFNVVTETLTANFSHGIGVLQDSSTCISQKKSSIQPSGENESSETCVKSFDGSSDQGNKFNEVTETATPDLPHQVLSLSDSTSYTSNEKSSQPSEDTRSLMIPLKSFGGMGDNGKNFNIVTETLTADLSRGIGELPDSSTYLSEKKSSTKPTEENKSETCVKSFDGIGDQGNKFNEVTETITPDLPHEVLPLSDSSTYTSNEKSAQPSEDTGSSVIPLKSFDGMGDHGNKFNIVKETPTSGLPYGIGALSDSSTYILDGKSSTLPSEEISSSETSLITTSQFSKLSKVTLAADLESLRRDLAITEEQLRTLPTEGVEAMLEALVKCGGDLKTHQLTAGCILEGVLVLPQDEETEDLQVEVDSIRGRIAVLEEQVEAGRRKLQSSYDTKDKLHEEIGQYRHLLEELEKWFAGIKIVLKTDLNKNNAEEQVSVHQNLLEDLAQRQKKLSELRSSCSNLENFEDVKDLASELNSSLTLLDTELSSAKNLTEDRLKTLQDLLKVQPELPAPVLSPSPVAATYPVLSPIESPVHETSRDDTIASNVSPIPDEEIVVLVPFEVPKPELTAQDSATQTGRSLSMSPEKQIHMEVQTDSATERPAAVGIQTDNGGWGPKMMPKGKIQILQKVEGNEETIEIATKSNVESHMDPESTMPGEDLTVEIRYKENKEGHEPTISELNISHLEPQSFETIVVDPGESSTEVIVDADGTKRIVVRKTKKIISHRTMTSGVNMETVDIKPIAFSQVSLQQQQTSVTHTLPDGTSEVTTSQGYVGQIASGTHDGPINTAEFSNMPRQVATYQTLPSAVDSSNIPEGLDTSQLQLAEQAGLTEWTTGCSTVRAVVHQVRRRIIRRTRRIIRKVVVIDGKEHVTEEVIEEPEEVEISEDGVPRVSIEVSKESHGGMSVQEPFDEDHSLQDAGVEISEILPGDDYDDRLKGKEASPTTISPPSESYKPEEQLSLPHTPQQGSYEKNKGKYSPDSKPIQTLGEKECEPKPGKEILVKIQDPPSIDHNKQCIDSSGDKDANILFIESEKTTIEPINAISTGEQQIFPLKEEKTNLNIECKTNEVSKKSASPETVPKDVMEKSTSADKTLKKEKKTPDKESIKKTKRKSKEKTPSPEEIKLPGKHPVEPKEITKEIDKPSKHFEPTITEENKSKIVKTPITDNVPTNKDVAVKPDSQTKENSPEQVISSISEDETSGKSKFSQKRKNDKKSRKGKMVQDPKASTHLKENSQTSKEILHEVDHEKIFEPKETLVGSDLTKDEVEEHKSLLEEAPSPHKTLNEVDQKSSTNTNLCEESRTEMKTFIRDISELTEGEEVKKENPELPSEPIFSEDKSGKDNSLTESSKDNISDLSDDGSKSTLPIVETKENFAVSVSPSIELQKHELIKETLQPTTKPVGNIEIEIIVKERTSDALKESIPKVVSDTKIEPKVSDDSMKDTMEIVKQKSDVVLPGVVQTTREIVKKKESPSSSSSSKGSKIKNKNQIPSPEELSTPTSLGESMEIVLPGSPNSSDTTKPTQQEIFETLSPRSDVSQLEESIKTYDTGYEGEDKTTVDESSLKEDDIAKSKKKKKKKQKLKEIIPDDHSSVEPKSSDFVPSDAAEETSAIIVRDTTAKKHKGKKPGKKTKDNKDEEKIYVAQSGAEENEEGSIKDLTDHSASDGVVKIVQESMPTGSSSEAEEFKSTNVLASIPVLEVLPTQSESVQTITPIQEEIQPVDTADISTQVTQNTQEMFVQTSTPEHSSIEAFIQTIPGELVPTTEEYAQTITPKVQSPIETLDSTMQTVEEERPTQQEEEIQTDEVKFGSLDNVDNSMQTMVEETRVFQEETVQTSPEPEKIQSFSQVILSDLIPTEEEESQTVDQTVTTVDLSTQITSSDLIPTHDESIQTMTEERPQPSPVTHLADKQEDVKPEIINSKEIVPTEPEKSPLPEKSDTTLILPEAIKTADSITQTKPVKIRSESESNESHPPTEVPYKIEIEATVSYGPEIDTDISTSDLSKSDSSNINQPTKGVCAPPTDSTDSETSSWASHKMRSPSPQNKNIKKPKQRKQKISEGEIIPVIESPKLVPQLDTVEKEKSLVKPEIKARITFDVDEYHSSVKPELIAEISQDKNVAGLFIQAELKPEQKSQFEEKLPGFSQTVELEMSSDAGNKHLEESKPGRKTKKDRRIRQRAGTKALPEASLVLSHEELRGEHSPGPPESLKTEIDPIKNKKLSTVSSKHQREPSSKTVTIEGTLTTPSETKNVEFSSPHSSIDVQFTIHEGPDRLSLEEKKITGKRARDISPQIKSPDYKTDSQMFIDYESTGDSISSQSEIPRDPDGECIQKTESKPGESQSKDLEDFEIKPKSKKSGRSGEITKVEKDPEVLDSQLKKVGDTISSRVKQSQQHPSSTCILFLTSLEQDEPSTEERKNQLEDSLESLQEAVKKQDIVIIQQTIIVTVETISTWLETIEYKIQHTKQSSSHGTVPEQRLEQLSQLQEEISRVESGVAALGDIVTHSDVCEQQNIRRVIDNLQQQVATVEETAKTTRNIADKDLARWEEFLNGVNNVSVLVEQLRSELEELVEDQNTPALMKLNKLEALEATNHSHKAKCAVLLSTAHGLLRDFPGRVIPLETYTTQDTTQAIEHNISVEREKLLQLVSLADEYEQTLKDFAQITDVAEALVDGPIVVYNLQHLQEEMQKHRKFFVNLSHCRGILESLEGHLDSETRTKHSALHDELHRRASMILDKAAGRAQQMALAASRWTVLEQGMKEERGWLQVANQRVPDLSTVTTSDYNQYISMYQSLSSDIALHAARAGQLVCVAHGLQGLVQSESCAIYDEHHAAILALQTDVNTELGRLLAFRDSWTAYELLTDKLDAWVQSVPMDTTPANMRQFWELKAQFELHKHLKDEAAAHLDSALRVIPVADETLQRQFQTLLLDRWKALEARLDTMQTIAMENLSAGSGSVEDKLSRLERELTELATLLSDMHGVIKTEEELQLYIERMQVMRSSVDHIMEQLSRLGLLSTAQSDRVSSLLAGARATELSLREELEMATLLADKLAALRRGVARVRRDQQRASSVLDQCEASLCQNQDTVQQALVNCQGVEEALAIQWGELMMLRQLLHTLPSRLRLSMSPVRVERELTQLQDDHSELAARCKTLNANLIQRLALWRRFYSQLELVQQSVRETDYMMEILAVQGQVDYERLVTATERLEGLSESLEERESQLEGLRAAAEPLQSSCSPEVAREIEAAVTEVVAAWEDTVTSLQGLCTRYQHAVRLWKQYREASEALSKWADSAADAVDSTDPQHAVEHVKVCEEKLTSQQARLVELQDLVAQIAADVGLDPKLLLGGEVAALGAKLEDVRESLAALVEAAEEKVVEQERCTEDLREAKDFLTTVQKSLQVVDSSGDSGTLEQLTALRNHLIALGKSDGQIQALRDKSADLPPGKQEISVMDILQLWQQVFRETFQQYHRLSARLVRDQEGLEALRLWEEYLLHVQAFLTSAIPDDYNALSEHQNLCQVHQNLLSSQQSLLLNKPEASMELSVAEQFNSLTNLHNETLARIMEREAQVRNRMNIWDQYRHDHKALLAWLGDAEKDKNRLRLRYVHMRMIPKTIQRIEVMLGKLPVGEEKAEKLGAQLQQLCQFCDETLATSLRLEHAAVTEKINSMRAALHTWLNFLIGLRELTERYEKEVEAVQRTFSDIHVALEDDVTDGSATCVPASHHSIQQRLDALKAARERVGAVSSDLELLGVTQEQLKESLNPVDVKTVSQRLWLLQQQHGDLEHQLDMAIYQLEEKLRQGQMFDKRAERFLVWAGGVDRRLEGLSSAGAGEPADQLRRLETELEAEVGLRRREADWLLGCGTELVEAEGLEATPRRAQLTNRLSAVNTAWERVQHLTSARANKLRQIIEGMSTLEQRIEELRGWLHSIELQLATPIILEHCTQAGLDKCMAHHDALTKDIEQHSGTVADVLNHCELLLNDCDSANVQLNTDGISTSMQLLERRWKNVCVLVMERKTKLLRTWQLLQDVLRLCEEQAAWLRTQTEALDRISEQTDGARIQAIPVLIADVEKVLTEVECQRPALELLQSSYTALAMQSSLESLTTEARSRIAEWSALRSRVEHLLSRLHAAQDRWLRFTEAHGTAVLALTNVDVQLTQIDLLETSDDSDLETHKNKLKKLMLLKQELEGHGELLKRADQLGLDIMNSCLPQDVPSVQQMVDEYQLLWKDIIERLKKLIEACKEECRKRNVVNEEVQVETLKFETDTSVQVNTLPVPLLRKDAYIYELQTAIKECNSNLDAMAGLEKLTTQNSAKCIAACQSSVDLVRHLSGLLMEQCGASEEQACSSEVEQLEQRYKQLLSQKQTEEREQRELSESGRFTCPLCTRRNWKQLDNDLWRLEKWLEFAEATQTSQTSPPSNINQLEDVIQDQKEFLLKLDSHKSLVVSLNTVGRHLAEHTEDEARAHEMTQRLAEINQRWDNVCGAAAVWETRLQKALMQSPEFYENIEDLVQWLEQTETTIQQMEPVDVADGREVIESKYNKFKDLRHDLEVFEPRVLSLQEAACHLLRHRDSETTNTNACDRLTHLRLRLQSLMRLTNSYLLKLGTVLGKDPISHTSLATLSHELLDQAAGGGSSSRSSTDQLHSNSEGLVDTSVLARGYRFLGRVVRASLPIQALMLVMLGVASLVPITEEDFACSISRAFGPTLRYVNGPPPM